MKYSLTEEDIKSRKFGLPRFKKYPMPDAAHVRSAIKFFNYVTPANEKELAKNILARMDEYGISPDDINVGDNNRFKKYLKQDSLTHHGIKGMKWGRRRYQNPDGTLTPAGRAKKLNDYDQQLRVATMNAANSAHAYKRYSDKAKLASNLGKTKKAQKLANKADSSRKRYEAHNKRMSDIGKKYIDELRSLKDSGLAYKIDNVNFTGASFRNGRAASRDIIKKYGRESWSDIVSNAASGNVYKVKDPSKMSKKKQIKWSNKHNIQSIRPQQIIYQ